MLSLQVQAPSCYADIVNRQFDKSESQYIDLQARLNSALQEPWKKTILKNSIKNFRNNNPHIKKWNDITLCKTLTTTLSKIDIDITAKCFGELKKRGFFSN